VTADTTLVGEHALAVDGILLETEQRLGERRRRPTDEQQKRQGGQLHVRIILLVAMGY
jgi:hypothetical protein